MTKVMSKNTAVKRSRVGRIAGLFAALACLSLLSVSSASATQTHLFKETFGPVQQPTFPVGSGSSGGGALAITTIQSSGDLLVLSFVPGSPEGTFLLSRFKPNGEPDPFSALGTNVIDAAKGPGGKPCAEEPASCDASPVNGFKGIGDGDRQQIAVDNSAGPASGDIYVLESGSNFLDVFAPDGHYLGKLNKCGGEKFGEASGLAVDPNGDVYVSDIAKQVAHKFTPAANPPKETDCSSANDIKSVARPTAIAAGVGPTAGYLFITTNAGTTPQFSGGLFKVNASNGELSYPILEGLLSTQQGSNGVAAVAVDPANGHLFVAQHGAFEDRADHIDEYDASGSSSATLASTTEFPALGSASIAFAKAGGDIYVARKTEHVETYGAMIVTQPGPTTEAATNVTPSKAVLHGSVDPDGEELTECVFEYELERSGVTNTAPCVESPAAIGSGHGPVPVHAPVMGLKPNGGSSYLFHLAAANSNHVKAFGKNQKFETKKIATTEPATAITGTTATLNGMVNPDGSAVTECQFEYLPAAEFVREVQTITLSGATGGTFKLGFEGKETGGQGEGKLSPESTTVSEVSVSSGAFSRGNLVTGTGIKPGTTIASLVETQNQVTSVTLSQPTEAVVPGGKTTLATELTSNATAEAVQAALGTGLAPALRAVNVGGADGGPYTVTFSAPADVPLLSADASGLTPPGAEVTVATQTQGKGFAQGTIAPCEESAGEIGEGEDAVPVHADISGLEKGTKYGFRFTGANALDGVDHEGERSFTTQLESSVVTKPASLIGGSLATLNGTVNPGGEAVSECLFEYVDAAGYEPSAPNPYAAGATVPCVESEAEIGTGTSAVPVHADITGLGTATTYHFRLLANPNGTIVEGEDEAFAAGGPSIEAQWAVAVGTEEATLAAEINPNGSATTYHVEYGKAAGPFEAITPESESIGSGNSAVKVEVHLSGLEPVSDYVYRFVATSSCNALNPSEACVYEGPAEPFHTVTTTPEAPQSCPNEAFRGGSSARLPDCRAYEMVSPVEKNGANVGTGLQRSFAQADEAGARFTFTADRSFADPEGSSLASQYLATRVEGSGWQTRSINPPRSSISAQPIGFISFQYKAFSPDLCSGWFVNETDLQLTEGAPEGVPNLYRRELCGGDGYELMTSAPPPSFHLEPSQTPYFPEPQGASADGTRTVFRANDALTPNAAPHSKSFQYQLYESQRGGPLRLVSVLPSNSSAPGEASADIASAGTAGTGDPGHSEDDNVVGAVSTDGEHVFWTASKESKTGSIEETGLGALYLRINSTEPESAHDSSGKCIEPSMACTYPVSGLVSASGPARFRQGNPESTRAIFSIADKLYEFETTESGEGLGTEANLIAEGFEGFLGASRDVTKVYFASSKALAKGGVGGKNNLYLYERGNGFRFVGVLSDLDLNGGIVSAPSGAGPAPLASLAYRRTSRVSPDGTRAAFTSAASLTGYDNTDATNGKSDTEVFVYDASADGGEGKLVCASCNPSGVRPTGRLLFHAFSAGKDSQFWGAAEIPGWTSQSQPSRALSDNGARLFFNSYDALLPQDTNGAEDVYEWEAPGEGSCTEESTHYFASNGGCLYLITSGKSPRDSEFFDATPEGKDVFFATLSSLLPQDNGLIDVYDARVDGGLPEPPGIPASCEGEACQGAQGAPQDPTPASSNLKGIGNLHETSSKPRCSKARVRRKGRCVPRHQKKRHAKRRAHRYNNTNRRAGR